MEWKEMSLHFLFIGDFDQAQPGSLGRSRSRSFFRSINFGIMIFCPRCRGCPFSIEWRSLWLEEDGRQSQMGQSTNEEVLSFGRFGTRPCLPTKSTMHQLPSRWWRWVNVNAATSERRSPQPRSTAKMARSRSPGALHRFLARFEQVYGKTGKTESIIAVAAAHHRLLWMHPFLDGNGRVARLVSHAQLLDALDTGTVWSVARGLARNVQEYKMRWQIATSPVTTILMAAEH